MSDLLVGIPIGSLFLWAAKILYDASKEITQMKSILFGVGDTTGKLAEHDLEINRAHDRLDRHSSVLQAVVKETKVEIPEQL